MEETSNIDITEIIAFIEQQKQKTDYDNVEKVVLFLGRTGTGKSTLTNFLVNPSEIKCVGKEGQFIMVDEKGHISDPDKSIISKTIYPEPLQYDNDLYYMDCPGFRDTRSFSMEIVSTIFTKKALKNARGVKIIFVMSYEEVKTGGDRNAFIDLVENANDFINELDKFDNSIALFVTKVPNLTKVENGNRVLIPDSSMKQHVMDFLKTTMKTIKNPDNITKGKRLIFKKAEEFINILIEDGENDCSASRIGIFRAPEQEGPISKIESFQRTREALTFIIQKVLDFTDVYEEDFGYTISNGSKLCIMRAIEDSVKSTTEIVSYLCTQAITSWRDFEIQENDFQKLSEHFNGELSRWKKTYDKLQIVEVTSEALNYLLEHAEHDPIFKAKHVEIYSNSENGSECSRSEEKYDENNGSDISNSGDSGECIATGGSGCVISSIEYDVEQLKNHAELIELMEMVSNEKYRISIAKWTSAFKQAFDEVSTTSDWYSRVPILIIMFKYTSLQKGPKLLREFMAKLNSWIQNEEPVPGEVFRDALSQTAKEFSVLQIGYDISIPKLNHLYKLCKAGNLDVREQEPGFWGAFKRTVGTLCMAGTNIILKLLSGKSPFEGDLFGEVRKICHMNE